MQTNRNIVVGGACALILLTGLSDVAPGQDRRSRAGDSRSGELVRPLLLTGQVVMADGTRLPPNVQIELMCEGSIVREMYVKGDGLFSFEIGGTNGYSNEVMGAETGTLGNTSFGQDFSKTLERGGFPTGIGVGADNRGRTNLTGCLVRASSPGLASDSIDLGVRRVFDDTDLGTITLTRLEGVKGTSVSLTTLSAPEAARTAFQNAQKELGKKKGNLSKAAKELEKATDVFPGFAEAWALLGKTRLAMKDEDRARKAFERSIESDSAYVDPYLALAEMAVQRDRWEEGAARSAQVLELNPYLIPAHYFQSLAQFNLGDLELAEMSCRKVQESRIARRYPGTHYILGVIHANRGDLPAAVAEFNRFLEINPGVPAAERLKKQMQEWVQEGLISPDAVAAKP